MSERATLTVREYNYLSIVGEPFIHNEESRVYAVCKCGSKMKDYLLWKIKSGRVKSCGCLRKEAMSKSFKKHGYRNHPIYTLYMRIKSRCYCDKNISYKYYGGRGITMCDEWYNDFMAFYNWAIANRWENGLSIERNNVNGNYEPNNCSFIKIELQSRNRRITKLSEMRARHIRILHKTSNRTYTEIAFLYGVSDSTIGEIVRNKAWV